MADKSSFILYLSSRKQWSLLNYEQKGRLIDALFDYVENGTQIQTDDGMLMMAFSFIADQIDRDTEKYANRCKKNKQIADEREQRRRNERDNKDTNVHERERTSEFATDNDTENDSDFENDNECDIKSADKPRRTHASKFIPPTVEEVRAYCKERGNQIDAERFVAYHAEKGWKIRGTPITDWKAAIVKWEQVEKQQRMADKTNQPRDSSFDISDFDKLVNRF